MDLLVVRLLLEGEAAQPLQAVVAIVLARIPPSIIDHLMEIKAQGLSILQTITEIVLQKQLCRK